MPRTPQLIAPRLLLRPWQPTDLPVLSALLADPQAMCFWPRPYTAAEAQAWLAQAQIHYEEGIGRMAVLLRDSGAIIGDAGWKPLPYQGRPMLDLGYIIDHRYQGQGYGSEAASTLLRYAREELGLSNLLVNMPDHHHASRRVAEQLGFQLHRIAPNPRNRDLPTRWYLWPQVGKLT